MLKIGGIEVNGPAEEILVLPRLDHEIVFRARAVSDLSHFEALCPMPKMPKKIVKGGAVDDPNEGYVSQVAKRDRIRFAYICIKSLEPSEVEWQTVDLDDPSTWEGWSQELTDAGFSSVEVQRIVVCVMQANSLDEAKLKAAREAFLRGPEEAQPKSSGQSTEPKSTPSGVPASDSE